MTYGRSKVKLRLVRNDFIWNFALAFDQQPSLDVLIFSLIRTRIARRRLLSFDTLINPSVCNAGPYFFVFDEFKNVFRVELKQVPKTRARHGICHSISTNGPLVYSRFRRLPPAKFQTAKSGICRNGKNGSLSEDWPRFGLLLTYGAQTWLYLETIR